MKSPIKDNIKKLLGEKLLALESHLNADVLVYTGDLGPVAPNTFLNIIEELVADKDHKDKLYVILTTNGGSAQTVERYVNILRRHYVEINFIVPDYAYSAGTIFCMSGDSIMMDYFSVLGPIDPQVPNKDGHYVAALGYLDKVNEFITKASNGQLTNAELIWLKEIDLAELRSFEQARDLTIDLLKNWLVTFKFKNWNNHRDGTAVTLEQKTARAEEIAKELSDNKKWKSHGRGINIEKLTELKLKIDDYSTKNTLRSLIREYYNTMTEYLQLNQIKLFVHNRVFL